MCYKTMAPDEVPKTKQKDTKKKKNYQASQNECVSITRIEEKKIVMRQLEMETSSINRDNKKKQKPPADTLTN